MPGSPESIRNYAPLFLGQSRQWHLTFWAPGLWPNSLLTPLVTWLKSLLFKIWSLFFKRILTQPTIESGVEEVIGKCSANSQEAPQGERI